MSHHLVLSRKYRPQRFDQLVGQEHVTRILQNTLTSGRVGHAYLLVGPRGVGKTTTARIFARALNCAQLTPESLESDPSAAGGAEPCGECPSCLDIAAGSDLDVVEMDAASNNAVDDVRALREQVGYATVRSRYRIWIVDEVHMLSLPAFNAFLKTLEEPPPQVKFLFCTTEEHKLPDTFRSRCQRVEFRPIAEAAMADRLCRLAAREDVELEEGLAAAIAHGALGGLRDAESQLEQLIAARGAAVGPDGKAEPVRLGDLDALSGRASADLLERLCAAVDSGEAGAALDAVDACLAAGSKPGVLLDQWLEHLRAQMVDAVRSSPQGFARLARAIDVLLGKRAHLRAGADGGLVAQVAAIELARLPDARDLDRLIAALRDPAGRDPAGSVPRPGGSAPHPSPPADRAPGPVASGGAGAVTTTPAPPPPPAERPPTPAPMGRPSPAPARTEPLDTHALEGAWNQVLALAGARNPALGTALKQVVLREVRDGAAHLSAADSDATTRGTLMRREVQLAFGQIVREAAGEFLRIVVVDRAPRTQGVERIDGDMRVHPDVRRVTEATGGRLLNVERGNVECGEQDPSGGGA